MDWWIRGLVVASGIGGAAALGVMMIEIPTAIDFGLAVAVACGWCYWLEKKTVKF